MKTRVPLYAFMPYGAPELIEAERAHMLRALLAASLLVPALLLGAFTIAARFAPELTPALPRVVDFDRFDVKLPPTLMPVTPLAPIAPAPVAAKTGGDVIPVEDTKADPAATVPSQTEMAKTPGETAQPGAGERPFVAPPEAVPDRIQDNPYVEEFPILVTSVTPAYPEFARDANVEGTVRVLALIGRDGRVMKAEVAPQGSVPMLDEPALAAVRQFVFTPALVSGHPVAVWVSVPVVFRLH